MTWSTWMRRTGAAALALALAQGVPAAAQDSALLQYAGADRHQKLVEAARKEGTFTFYTTIAEKDIPPLIEPFEKKYGIKVRIWRAGTDKVLQRTLAETAARRYEVDAIHVGAPELEAMHREKILQPVNSPYFASLVKGAVPAHREWAATLLSVWVQAYNTNLIKKEDLPKTYQDLLDPRWKGRLGIESKVQEWYSTVVTDMGEEKGIRLFRDIVERNGISARKGHSLLNNMVIAGEVPLALTVYNYMPQSAKDKGAPIDWFVLEPAVARANGIGIARRAPHPNAAALFYDYMLSPDVQKLLVSMDYVPTNTAVPSPLDKNLRVLLVDPAMALDQIDKWTRSYEDVVTKRGGR
ncbi:ABC transporter substrate-binding protein [Telluria beijingensis]|uniref:ABC transporter substrate-binding protein n=1 Tax=Telluria beijingensis TaxID=3068633 RepID=UPI002795B533|nr:extracellular solute-binding protein [Massilia sp. REN29]